MGKDKKSIYNIIVPKFIRRSIRERQEKETILKHYNSLNTSLITEEEQEALNYLKANKICVFPYPFQNNYKQDDIVVFKDNELGLKYILVDDKRLYFKRKSSVRGIKRNYNALLIEQDLNSPHRYLTNNFDINNNDILVDVGAAEGNLVLSVIEKVSKVYLFETDEAWIEALNATFAPWKDKVEVVNKFVSNKNDERNVSLDYFFKDKAPFTFLKIDAEGSDFDVLKGGENFISSTNNLKIAICCYHKPDDEKTFDAYLTKNGFSTTVSKGYMIFNEPKTFTPPYLRRGVMRAIKNK